MRAKVNGTMNQEQDSHRAQTGDTDVFDVTAATGSVESFWDESQVLAVIRHAGATGRSPEEFFNRKWKRALFQGR